MSSERSQVTASSDGRIFMFDEELALLEPDPLELEPELLLPENNPYEQVLHHRRHQEGKPRPRE